jgi:DNA replication licensing factor MCM7
MLQVVAYSCDLCGCETFQEISQKQFTPLVECQSEDCKSKGVKGKLNMLTRASKFYRYQEARVQELVS